MHRNRSKSTQIVGSVVWLAVVFIAAAIGATASVTAGAFYAQLVLPAWAPPGSVFGPVWSVLYVLMGVAAGLVWRVGGPTSRLALAVFLAQLVLNVLWSWFFFGWHLGALAFADIVVLLVLIIANVVLFWKIKPLAGALLVPYLLWVGFASALNYAVWQLNPQMLG